MAVDRSFLLLTIIITFLVGFAASTTFISGDVLPSQGSTGRSLLQAKKSCPINFEFMNYTIITSKCKGPQYPPKLCCAAFKEFACPYAEEINDGSNECASTMFSYINLYGRYPPGLFASECREGKQGLECPADPPQSQDDSSSSYTINNNLLPLITTISLLLICFLSSC